ncbi:MAG: Asp-tRNA(Asn)/Glu-tRNA(Gln) amidotransferase subunit GatC [Acidobacteriota bacterium]|nr:Asp-tRNA(Asn)/Glu-tRNA(Gln) amidotransferase subunit GatC [Acidobacteriota bacterium]
MAITAEDIRKIAHLAHLEITDEEVALYTPQMASIVDYVEQLNELDTELIELATGGFTVEGEETNTRREDVPHQSLGQKAALAEAPDPAEGHFRVPKVL